MSYDLPAKLKTLTPYIPSNNEGLTILDANESPYPLSDAMAEEFARALLEVDFNRYPDPNAVALCEAAGLYYGFDPQNIVAGNGSDELIFVIMTAFCPQNGKILICEPDFSMYGFYCDILERERINYQKPELRIDVDELIAIALKERPDILVFSNPCNPTGQGIERTEILRLVKALDCLVVVDEAYMEFWGQSIIPDLEKLDNALVLRTCSKLLGLAALRLGFAMGQPKLAGAVRAAKSPFNVNSVTQALAGVFMRDMAQIERIRGEILRGREFLFGELAGIAEMHPGKFELIPTVANFVLLRSPVAECLHNELRRGGFAVRLLSGGYLRITVGNPQEINVFLTVFEEIIREGDG